LLVFEHDATTPWGVLTRGEKGYALGAP